MLILVDPDSLLYSIGNVNQGIRYHIFDDKEDKCLITFKDMSKKELIGTLSGGMLPKDPNIWYTTERYLKASIATQKRDLDERMEQILSDVYDGTEQEVRIYISNNKPTFRHKLATIRPYKGQRSSHKPLSYDALYNHIISKWGAIVVDEGIEPDDQVCIDAHGVLQDTKVPISLMGGEMYKVPNYVIVHIDKDLDQIPGTHYNFNTRKVYEVTKQEAMLNLYTQVIEGDDADNIQGIPGCGPVMAKKMLQQDYCKDYYNICHDLWCGVLSKKYKKEELDVAEEAISLQVDMLMEETLTLLTLLKSEEEKQQVIEKYN